MHSVGSYSQSLGLVSASFCDRYDMMLSSALALLILRQHSLRRYYSNAAHRHHRAIKLLFIAPPPLHLRVRTTKRMTSECEIDS